MIVRELVTVLGFRVNEQSARRYNNTLNKVKKTARTVVKGMALATGAATALGVVLLKGAGEIEQVGIAFETMIGSAERAEKLLKDITDFAAKTPFQLTGLIDNSKQLLAFGIEAEDIIETMTNLGNIAAGVGRDKLPTIVSAFGKIRTKGKASMEELNMLLEAGVPILDALAEQYDVSTQELFKLITAGKIMFEDVNLAIEGLATGTGKFAGLMEKQSKSFLGIISNIGDFLTNLGNDIGKELLPAVSELARKFLEFLEANRELIKVGAVKFFEKFVFAIAFAFFFMKGLIERLGGFQEIVGKVGDAIRGVFDFINKVFDTLGGRKAVFEGIKNIIGDILEFVGKLIEKSGGFESFVKILLALIVGLKLLKLLNMVGVFSGIATGLGKIGATAGIIGAVALAILGLAAVISSFGEKDPEQQRKNFEANVSANQRAIAEGGEMVFTKSANLPSMVNRGIPLTGGGVNVNVNSNVSLEVPGGSPQEQIQAVEDAAATAVQAEWESIMQEIVNNNPSLDFTNASE